MRRPDRIGYGLDLPLPWLPSNQSPPKLLIPSLISMERSWLNIAQALPQTGAHRQVDMRSIAFGPNYEETTARQLSQAARIFIVIARLHRFIDLASKVLKLFLIHSYTIIELDEQRVKWTRIIRPLRSHHPELGLHLMPGKRSFDSGA